MNEKNNLRPEEQPGLTPIERLILKEHGYYRDEISRIDDAIADGDEDFVVTVDREIIEDDAVPESEDEAFERIAGEVLEANLSPALPASILGCEEEPEAPAIEAFGSDEFPDLESVWGEFGVEGLITWYSEVSQKSGKLPTNCAMKHATSLRPRIGTTFHV